MAHASLSIWGGRGGGRPPELDALQDGPSPGGWFTKAVLPRPGFLSPAGRGLVPTCRCPGNNVEEGWASLTHPVSPQGL